MRRVAMTLLLAACTAADVVPDAEGPPARDHLPAVVRIGQGIYSTNIYATFEDGTDQLPTPTRIGDCLFDHYIIDRYPRTFDAGVITVESSSSYTLAKTRSTLGELIYQFNSKTHEFLDNELVGVSSTGATVPMFATVISMPAVATVMRPVSDTVRLDQPFEVTWTGGSGTLWVGIQSIGEWINCPFPATAGTGVIPVDTLASLRPGKGYLWVSSGNSAILQVGPWDLGISAGNQAAWQDGTAADISITVE